MVREGEESPMYLRGALSFGSNKCGVKYPAVFTNIESYIPWIKKNMYKEVIMICIFHFVSSERNLIS